MQQPRERADSCDTQVEGWEAPFMRRQRPRLEAWVQGGQEDECDEEKAPFTRRWRPRLDCDECVAAARNEQRSSRLASAREWLHTVRALKSLGQKR